jgi:toluene monooxygenase system ferredoxin subunit
VRRKPSGDQVRNDSARQRVQDVMEKDAVFHRVCTSDDIWAGDMQVFEVEGTQILLVRTEAGELSAIQHFCPHQQVPLIDGSLEGEVLTCGAHLWEVNVLTGKGVNPEHAEIARYPIKVEDDQVYVAVAGIAPKYSRP